jgi:hypothetical protein
MSSNYMPLPQQILCEFYSFKKKQLPWTSGSFYCQNNDTMISIIHTELFTFLTILTIRPSPTILHSQFYDEGKEYCLNLA